MMASKRGMSSECETTSDPDVALSCCTSSLEGQSAYYPSGSGGETNLVDDFVTTVVSGLMTTTMSVSSADVQTCVPKGTMCINSVSNSGCDLQIGTNNQTCVIDIDFSCLNNSMEAHNSTTEQLINEAVTAAVAGANTYENLVSEDESAQFASTLMTLGYSITRTVTQTCNPTIQNSNSVVCTGSASTSVKQINQCAYASAVMSCLQTNSSYLTAYGDAYEALTGSRPRPRGAYLTDEEQLAAFLIMTTVAFVVLILVCVVPSAVDKRMALSGGPWCTGIGLFLAISMISGYLLLLPPYIDMYADGATDASVDQLTMANQFNTALLGAALLVCSLLVGIGVGLWLHDMGVHIVSEKNTPSSPPTSV
jgi:hypothetical protein